MLTRATLRAATPRPARIVFVATLLLAGAAAAQPPRPAPPPVERIPAPPPPGIGAPDSLAHPDFSGVWVLNTKESDDPRPVFATMMPTERPAGGKPGKPGGRPGIGVRGSSGGGPGMGGGGMRGPGGMDDGSGMGGGAGRGGNLAGGDEEGTGERPVGEARFGGGGADPAAAKERQAFAARMAAGWQRLLIAQANEEIEIIDGREQRRIHVLDGQRRDRRGTRAGRLETARWEGETIVITLDEDGRPGMTQTFRLVPAERRLYVTLRLPVRGPGGEKVIRLVYESA